MWNLLIESFVMLDKETHTDNLAAYSALYMTGRTLREK